MSKSTPERWLPVPGYEGLYEVSDLGRIRSVDRVVRHGRGSATRMLRGRTLVPDFRPGEPAGYLQVHLSRNGIVRTRRIHHLACEAFHGPRPDGCLVRHLNGDSLDNRADNLAWGTPSENAIDSVRHGTHPRARRRQPEAAA